MKRCLPLALLLLAAAAAAQVDMPPQIGAKGQAGYREYLGAQAHRAFAIAPGGAWGWKGGAATSGDAAEDALASCQENTLQKCVLYGVDGKSVFDAAAWTKLWGPYANAAKARGAPVGNQLGDRFPDLAFAGADGRRLSVAGLAGRVAVLHFWGSWCGPCRREMPELQKLYETLKDRKDIAFVLLQAREPFAVSQRWAAAQGMRLPFHDSGATGDTDTSFRLADGARIGDREIAMLFPTTYVLDKRGVVVFAHVGPVDGWPGYRDFLLDAARRSGR